MTPREFIKDRLSMDLIGPYEDEEVLGSRPSDVYLTGILWSGDTPKDPDADERLTMEGEASDGIDSGSIDTAAPVSNFAKPSAMGISFAVQSTGGPPVITANVSFGLYRKNIKDGDAPADGNSEGETEGEPGGELEIKTWPNRTWRRVPFDFPVELSLEEGSDGDVDLTDKGAPEGVRLYKRIVPQDDRFLVTVTLYNNSAPTERDARLFPDRYALFQTKLEIRPGAGTRLVARRSSLRKSTAADEPAVSDEMDRSDAEDRSIALLYRNIREYAVGHMCSADWEEAKPPGTATVIRTTWIPSAVVCATSARGHPCFDKLGKDGPNDPLSAEWLASAPVEELVSGLSELTDAYEEWIDWKKSKFDTLTHDERDTAEANLNRCSAVAERMREGIEAVDGDPTVRRAFQLANRAIARQRRWSRARRGAPDETDFRWRPFQLGFILLSLSSVAYRGHADRKYMDLLWFPTGGGKTEAYLGLIAFIAFYRRLSRPDDPDSGAGVAAIMRYTLRLLTAQQFQRAASLILACETIRREESASREGTGSLGSVPFSIGIWVGGSSTPNTYEDAKKFFEGDASKADPRQLKDCPACPDPLKWTFEDDTVVVRCVNPDCELGSAGPLPIFTVDEGVFGRRPTLVIATIDKFAQIVRWDKINGLFSIAQGGSPYHPPDLILQDELHLISGPLGTIAGLYETAIDRLFTRDDHKPKVIGSTATIRRAGEQVKAVFDRRVCQFPPPGIDHDDSGFAVLDHTKPGRLYLGVTTAGRSERFALQAVAASLLQSTSRIEEPKAFDNYWTLVSYFNALRELGGAVVLMQDDVNKTIAMFAARRGEPARRSPEVEELTGRRTQAEILAMLKYMEKKATPKKAGKGALDVVLATSMLSVGVDIDRLGLMLVSGQPKSISEYIQATSRVGRGEVPGLIVSVLNNAKVRDRSHYEMFRTWHGTLYRDVEAIGATPFASRARDRALHAVLVALFRHLIPDMLEKPDLDAGGDDDRDRLIEYIVDRARSIDSEEADAVRANLAKLIREWGYLGPEMYWDDDSNRSLLHSAEKVAASMALSGSAGDAWSTMNSMRNVETSTPFQLKELT